ncbi:MAG: glycogen synthase [Eggerthellaceae bacterium]|nr:glycogen synthase [Eggerthellaceae bacterium]
MPQKKKAPAKSVKKTSDAKPENNIGVLIAAAECAPLLKVGGLADVVGALPKYLKEFGFDGRVILPFHREIKERYGDEAQHLCDFQASLGWRSQYVGLEKLELDGVVYYFIDNEFYFGGPVYCGGEFEGEQYAFFTRAVMDAIPQLDFDVKILHCNDWHTAMMPLLAKTQYHGGMQQNLRTVLTIHNLHFQGQFSHEFDRDLLRVDDSLATPEFIEHYGCDNMLKAGIVFADKVTTVSPTYAQEICEPLAGESLDGVLRSRGSDLIGILNGIDTDVWNPRTDDNLPTHYSEKSLARKRKVRDALLEELGLQPAGDDTAVIGMVGRLTPQKGVDLIQYVLDELMQEDVRVIILGSGWSEYEQFFRDAEGRHKGRLCSFIGYNGPLSHRIYGGSDLFLMPSLFEPCGISQLISMRYGTLPIVRETGGLKDTVTPYNEFTGEGNGFSFANYDAGEMLGVIRWALDVWRNPDVRKKLVKQAMESDFSFNRCAQSYAELYRSLL